MDNLTGATGICNIKYAAWERLNGFLNTKESWDDYESVKFSAADSRSSLFLSVTSESEEVITDGAFHEESKLQEYYFYEYMESCSFIKHNSCPEELLKNGRLDLGRFPELGRSEIRGLLEGYILHLKQLDLLHEIYAFRKFLAKCEFAMWEHAFSRASSIWSKLSYHELKLGVEQNLSLLDELKKDSGVIDPGTNSNICEGLSSKLMVEIDREYSKELLKFNERRIGRYNEYIKFRRLLKDRAVEAQAVKVRYLPKDYQLTAELQPQSVHNHLWSKGSQLNAWILQKMSLVKDRVGRKNFSGLSNRWSRLVLGGAAVLSFTTRANLKKG